MFTETPVYVVRPCVEMAEASSRITRIEFDVAQLIKSISDLTQCAVCRQTLTQPKLLPCFHTFCLGCLQKSFAGRQPGEAAACLLCRRVFNIPHDGCDALPPHFFVEHLLDARKISKQLTTAQRRCDVCCDDNDDESEGLPATSYCGECAQFLCNQCCRYKNRLKTLETLNFVALTFLMFKSLKQFNYM